VYRDNGLTFAPFTADGLGTYTPIATSLVSPDAVGLILYDSTNYMRRMTHGGAGAVGALSAAARAEGKRAKAMMSHGIIDIITSDWTTNSRIVFGWRIGVFKQDPDTGLVQVDPGYSMWRNIGETNPAYWANIRRNRLAEGRFFRAFNDGQNTGGEFQVPVMWKGRSGVSLDSDECLALYLEIDEDSVNMRLFTWVRSLIADEGGV